MKNKRNLLNNLQDIQIFLPLQYGDYIDIIDEKYIHVNKEGKPRKNKEE